jgi:6-pyruvoyltetrahydropterin/6-carboxytetrahydropterin synthase
MYTITKEFAFEASHRLLDMPEGHKCGRMHGHSYRVVVVLGSEVLDKYGFVIDYGDLDPLKQYIDKSLDHRHLNDVLDMRQPTAEKIAEHLFDFCAALWNEKVLEVRVSETAKTWAIYRPSRITFPMMTETQAAEFEKNWNEKMQGAPKITVVPMPSVEP